MSMHIPWVITWVGSQMVCGTVAVMVALTANVCVVGDARAADVVYDAFNDFSWTQNPTPGNVWSYGTKTALDGLLSLYTEGYCLGYRPEVCGWFPYMPPNVLKSTSGEDIFLDDGMTAIPGADFLNFHAWEGGVFSVVRWTAPAADSYDINATFKAARNYNSWVPTTTDVYVVLNGTQIFTGGVYAYYEQGPQAVFSTTLALNGGDTIDFVVDSGTDGDWNCDGTLLKAVIKVASIAVPIDIKPNSRPNSVNPYEAGVIKVAVLSTAVVNAADIVTTTVRFGVTGKEAAPVSSNLQDINGDGKLDLVAGFNVTETGIQCGDTTATLTGQLTSGRSVRGSDIFETVGCNRCVK